MWEAPAVVTGRCCKYKIGLRSGRHYNFAATMPSCQYQRFFSEMPPGWYFNFATIVPSGWHFSHCVTKIVESLLNDNCRNSDCRNGDMYPKLITPACLSITTNDRDLRSFEIRFEFESVVPIRFDSDGPIQKFSNRPCLPIARSSQTTQTINGA